MSTKKQNKSNVLAERMVRTEDIFYSLLYDEQNSTLRVVDFRGGNFTQKHEYLKRIQLAEGFRKVFMLIERDDIQGWQRCGYVREGAIPGYYRRSDAYLMSWLCDEESHLALLEEDEADARKEYISQIKDLASEYEGYKGSACKAESVSKEEVAFIIEEEITRRRNKVKEKKTKKDKIPSIGVPTPEAPLRMQFSRGVDYFYFSTFNKRTKQANLLTAEHQDCFGNAKIDLYFEDLKTKSDISLAKYGLHSFVEWLGETGSVALFALVDADNLELNAVFASEGFKNSGWLSQQVKREKTIKDQILWTHKFLI